MSVPSRAEQARALANWLEAGAEEGEDVTKFASRLVDAFHEMLKAGLEGPPMRLEVGTAFKSPLSSKVYWVAWQSGERYWITQADSSHGWLISRGDQFFEYASPSSAKTGKPGTNKDGWSVGDRVSAFQGALQYHVAAVHNRGVLLTELYSGSALPQSNEEMSAYYTKESK